MINIIIIICYHNCVILLVFDDDRNVNWAAFFVGLHCFSVSSSLLNPLQIGGGFLALKRYFGAFFCFVCMFWAFTNRSRQADFCYFLLFYVFQICFSPSMIVIVYVYVFVPFVIALLGKVFFSPKSCSVVVCFWFLGMIVLSRSEIVCHSSFFSLIFHPF